MCFGLSLLPRLACAWGLMSFFLAEEFRGPAPRERLWASGSVPCPARESLQAVVAQSLCQPCTLSPFQLGRLERTQVAS